jgi:DeoR/GlpR family transcriptional regulator of sugar metabolism/tRNA A-37 threonylcarbamoyl transferase component Bud32
MTSMAQPQLTSAHLDLRAEIHYELDPQPLGVGGFSVVHRAWEPGLDRWVALKVVTVSKVVREMGVTEEEIRERHRNEVRAVGRLRHDHIVEIYNYGHGEDTLWYAMTLLTGGSIRGQIRPESGRGSNIADSEHIVRWLEVLIRVCRTVGFCHGQGIIHRDLKPDNVLFDEKGRPTLTDFGIARIGEEEHAEQIFAGGDQVYSSPELLKGEPQSDLTDVYSLGCIAYFALTGKEPFSYGGRWDALARDQRAALKREVHPGLRVGDAEDFRLPQEHNPALREDLARIVLRAMSGDPAQRYSQPRVLADAFQEQLDVERTLRRVPTGEFVAERAASIITAFLRDPDRELDEATLLGRAHAEPDAEARRHLRELIRRGVVIEGREGYALARRHDLRGGKGQAEKRAIGEHVMRLITGLNPPVGLSIDGGSTTNEILRAIIRQPVEIRERIGGLRTNNTCWIWDTMGRIIPPGWRLLGGWVRPTSLATMGPSVAEQFRCFSPAVAVIGVSGVVAEPGADGQLCFSTDTEEETALKRTVLMSASLLSMIVFDSSKFGVGAGEIVMTLAEVVEMAKASRGARRVLLVTSGPSPTVHTGPDARRGAERDRQRFVENLRDLLRRVIERHGDRDASLTFTPIYLAAPSPHPPITLPLEGESVENLPFVFARHLAALTALPGDHEVVVSIEL